MQLSRGYIGITFNGIRPSRRTNSEHDKCEQCYIHSPYLVIIHYQLSRVFLGYRYEANVVIKRKSKKKREHILFIISW